MLHKAAKLLRRLQCCQDISGSDTFLLGVVFFLCFANFFVDFCFCKLLISKEQYFSILWSSTIRFYKWKNVDNHFTIRKNMQSIYLKGVSIKALLHNLVKEKRLRKALQHLKNLLSSNSKEASPVPCQLSLLFSLFWHYWFMFCFSSLSSPISIIIFYKLF